MSLENDNINIAPQDPEFPALPKAKPRKSGTFLGITALVIAGMVLGGVGGATGSWWAAEKKIDEIKKVFDETPKEPERIIEHTTTVVEKEYLPQTGEEQKVIGVAKTTAASVVSIVITKEVPVLGGSLFNPATRTEKQEVGQGTGFIVSKEGMVVTNKHVVRDKDANYTIVTFAGDVYPAIVLAKDPLQDIAVLKIDQQGKKMAFMPVQFGDSFSLEPGRH
ncbi:MAG: serine protease [Candidatus Wildermuthbacteria bacterium]|nr:serine protease [Candidatus Wildermuthbacteria bacterium]